MQKEKLLSIIIPGYNEEKVVAKTINSVEKAMSKIKRPYEILIVDDGSKDNTAKIVQRFLDSKKHPNLRFISYRNGPSRRENLAKSFKLLKGDYIILLDMDLSMDVKHVKDFLAWLDNGYDIVIPNRYHSKSKIKRKIGRYIVSKIYNALLWILFRSPFKDNICGFKAFKRNVVMDLINEAGIDKTRTRSVFWDSELLIHALRKGYSIKEIPVYWVEGKNSALNFKRERRMIPYIIKFRLGLVRNEKLR